MVILCGAALAGELDLDAQIPLDPAVTRGQLGNGLTWFAERHAGPAHRAQLRLVVDAGSVLEAEDERGAAHFVEHMGFNGTARFPEGTLLPWAEGLGMRFGPDINAHTSYDATVYQLEVPTDDPGVLARAFDVLADWAGGMLLADDAIERERGVVLAEWRTRLGESSRVWDRLADLEYGGSVYADRPPIGTGESIRDLAPDVLRRFYRDWYRPDLMAVVAVGDLDPAAVAALVRERFGGLANPAPERERVRPAVAAEPSTRIAVVTDPEVTTSSVALLGERLEPWDSSWLGYRAGIVEQLIQGILVDRIIGSGLRNTTALTSVRARDEWLAPALQIVGVEADVRGADEMMGVEALAVELARLRRFGATDGELDRARRRAQAGIEQIWEGRDARPSSSLADELVRAFLRGEPVPGIEAERDATLALIGTITSQEVAFALKSWPSPGGSIVEVVLPDAPGAALPTETDVTEALARAEATAIEPPPAEGARRPTALVRPPRPGKVVSREEIPALDTTVVHLANGVEVWLKSTSFQANEVRLEGWSPGGLATVADSELVPAWSAAPLRGLSGLGGLSSGELHERLAGSTAWESSNIERFDDTIHGRSAPGDLETMLQLVWLEMTDPAFSDSAMFRYRKNLGDSIRTRANDPQQVFEDAWDALVWHGARRMLPWSIADLGQLDLAASARFWHRRFGNAADFRWALVGSFDPATAESLIARYLGRLPASKSREERRDDGVRPVTSGADAVVRAGSDPKSRVRWRWSGPFSYGWDTRARLGALGDLLEVRLREVLREVLGGTYGVDVTTDAWMFPEQGYDVQVDYVCDPVRVSELQHALSRVVDELRSEPLAPSYIAAEQEQVRRAMDRNLHSNGWWASSLVNVRARGEDPRDLLGWSARNDALGPEVVRQAASDWLDPTRVLRMVLLPKDE